MTKMHLQQTEVLAWSQNYLKENGYQLQNSPEIIHNGPWSTVYRILTNFGTLYLKQTAPDFAIEPTLLRYLGTLLPSASLEVLAQNDKLYCFLMRDAGTPLRDILKKHFQINLANNALTTYATIQKLTANHIDTLLSMGVPDWRLSMLPSLYLALLNQKQFLIDDGLSPTEIEDLKKLHLKVVERCHQLAQYNIPETIEHGDFHDNNILVQGNNMIIHDWGEATITHPFFSLTSYLYSALRVHNFNEASDTYKDILNGYLNNWLIFENHDKLVEATKLAHQLGYIKFALAHYRIAQCPGFMELGQYKGRLTQALQSCLKEINN